MPAFAPLLKPSRYKALFGGRGSGKSHFLAEAAIELCYQEQTRFVCIREVQNTIKDSVRQLLVDKIQALDLGAAFDCLEAEIRCRRTGSLIIFRGMQNFNAESIKSLEGYDRAWVEEAQTMSQRSLDMLRPTIRKPASELWFSWNPESELDAVDRFFRGATPPEDAIIVELNWQDNDLFPEVLRREMELDRSSDPIKAAHVWDGGYRQVAEGAYYAPLLAEALSKGRITNVPLQPKSEVYAAFDRGVGRHMAIWFAQWIGPSVRVIDYLEGNDEAAKEGLSWFVRKLRERNYTYAPLILPHDARHANDIVGKSMENALRDFKFQTQIVPAMKPDFRVDLVKQFIPTCWFDADKCRIGLKALQSYRVNYDDKLRIDRGPLHDWASHAADAFGHMAQAYDEPQASKKIDYSLLNRGIV